MHSTRPFPVPLNLTPSYSHKCSLTAHPAANGYLVGTLGKLKAARKGTGHPTSLCRRLRISVSLTGTPQRTESYTGLTFTFTFTLISATKSYYKRGMSKGIRIHNRLSLVEVCRYIQSYVEKTQETTKYIWSRILSIRQIVWQTGLHKSMSPNQS